MNPSDLNMDTTDSNSLYKKRSYIPKKGGHGIIKLRQSLNVTQDMPDRSVINTP